MFKPITDAGAFAQALMTPNALLEAGLVLAGLFLAAGIVRLLRGREERPGSVWFGDHLIDGVLFPVIALVVALVLRWILKEQIPLTVMRIAVPILVSLVIVRTGVRVLRVAFPASPFVRLLERTLSWVVWLGLVLWVTGGLPLVMAELDAITWTIGGTPVSLRSVIEGVLTAGAVLVLMLWLSAAIEARLLAGVDAEGVSAGTVSVRKIAANAARALLLLIGLLMALSAAGIPLGALSVLGGAVGVGIGLGLQRLAANYVSGFVILAERSVRIGDMVKVDNFEGRITDIKTRYTVVRALNGRESIVPNEMLISQRVENSSLADPRVLAQTTVQVAYGTDLDVLMPLLTRVVAGVPRVLSDPGPSVHLSNFASDGLELTVNFWIGDPENGQGNVRSGVNLALLKALNDEGIEIPFPQRVMRTLPAAPGAAS